MRHKVIFDTNVIRNERSINEFFGGRDELEQFLKVADVLIPQVVIDEIRTQKVKYFVDAREAFIANPFHQLRKLQPRKSKNFDIGKFINKLFVDDKIPYQTIELTDTDALRNVLDMCLRNKPPFTDKSDAGFKDACIFLTVMEYLEKNEDENVFFVTKDSRLKVAFEGSSRVVVVHTYAEFEKYITDYFREDYFIGRLREEFDAATINPSSIKRIWFNFNENWILEIDVAHTLKRVEVDFQSKEIMDSIDSDDLKPIDIIIASGSQDEILMAIDAVENNFKFLHKDEICRLLYAAATNKKILSITNDHRVKDFFLFLFSDALPGKEFNTIPPDIEEQFKKTFLQIVDAMESAEEI